MHVIICNVPILILIFFSFGYIRDEYYLQLVNVIGSGKIRK